MANPLPNEKELYQKIEGEKITIPDGIWDLLYHRIGDDVTAINLLCQYYFSNQQAVPLEEAKKILLHTHHIKDIVDKITHSSRENFFFPEFINDVPLHPALREMLTHYIGNDVYMINLIVGNAVDPLAPEPLSQEDTQKVLNHTRTIRGFMEKLRQATSPEYIYKRLKEGFDK